MFRLFITFGFLSMMAACNNNKSKSVTPAPVVVYKTDTAEIAQDVILKKAPVINIVDTLQLPGFVIVVQDSAATSDGIGVKMNHIYSNVLPAFIHEKKLEISGPRMAWYKSSAAPFFFEAGYYINKRPSGKLPKNFRVKEIKNDSAFVAHYFGPYENTYHAYEAVKEWMQDYKKKSSGAPYEMYIGSMYDSTGRAVDPYRVQTDIVFPHK